MASITKELSSPSPNTFIRQGAVDRSGAALAQGVKGLIGAADDLIGDDDTSLAPLQEELENLADQEADVRTALRDIQSRVADPAQQKQLKSFMEAHQRLAHGADIMSLDQIRARRASLVSKVMASNPELRQEIKDIDTALFGGFSTESFALDAAQQEAAKTLATSAAMGVDPALVRKGELVAKQKQIAVDEGSLLLEQGKANFAEADLAHRSQAQILTLQAVTKLKVAIEANPTWKGGVPPDQGTELVETLMASITNDPVRGKMLLNSRGQFGAADVDRFNSYYDSVRTILTTAVNSKDPAKMLNDLVSIKGNEGFLRLTESMPFMQDAIVALGPKEGTTFLMTDVPAMLDKALSAGGSLDIMKRDLEALRASPTPARRQEASEMARAIAFVEGNFATFQQQFANGLAGLSQPERFNKFVDNYYSRLYGEAYAKMGNPSSPNYDQGASTNALTNILEFGKIDPNNYKALLTPQTLVNLKRDKAAFQGVKHNANFWVNSLNNDGSMGLKLWQGSLDISFNPASGSSALSVIDRGQGRKGMEAQEVFQADTGGIVGLELGRTIKALNTHYGLLYEVEGAEAANSWAQDVVMKSLDGWKQQTEREVLDKSIERMEQRLTKNVFVYDQDREQQERAEVMKRLKEAQARKAQLTTPAPHEELEGSDIVPHDEADLGGINF